MSFEFEERKVTDDLTRCVASNYFSKECEKQTKEYIEAGYWVSFCATCIGHTRAQMFEDDGERFLIKQYGEANIQAVRNDWGTKYYRLR